MGMKSLMPFRRSTAPSRTIETMDPFFGLRQGMDELFDSFSRGWGMPTVFEDDGFLTPRVDVAETDAGLEISAELPGLDAKDISLDLADDVLTLKAERKSEKDEKDEKKHYHLIERSSGTYMRRFALPFAADRDKVTAAFDKGVLKVMVPRAPEAEKPATKIEVKAA